MAEELKHASKDGLWGFARLFLFPKVVLRSPPRGGKKKRVVVKAVLLSRIQRWLEGDFVSLWEEARLDASHGNKSANRSHVSLDSANAKRSLSLAREGCYSDAMRLLGSSGCTPHDDPSAVSELRSRHPHHCLPSWNTDILSPLVVTSSSVLAALHGFPKVSSPGGSKLRCQHLLDVIEGSTLPSVQECFANLTNLVCFLVSGQAHPSIAPWLCGAPLMALYKKQGGVCPIAVREVLRRLTSRLCCSVVRENCRRPDVFLPSGQIGVGIRGGLEAAIHSLSTVIDSQGSNPDLCCLKVDFSNAFNECHRSSFLEQVQKDFPRDLCLDTVVLPLRRQITFWKCFH